MTMYLPSLLGGLLIGLSAAALLLFNGKTAGISGIAGDILQPVRGDTAWRVAFLGGLIAGGLVLRWMLPESFGAPLTSSPLPIVAAGLLVGFGTRLGNGCTSGHGICGIGRGSPRGIAATMTFMLTGAATVYLVHHVFGGLS